MYPIHSITRSNPYTLRLSKLGIFLLDCSDKKVVLPYQMWLASKVIPSIRKHGAYAISDKIDEVVESPELSQVRVVMPDSELWLLEKMY